MACPALPLCGLAISEAERGLPDVNLRIRNLLNKLGFDQAEQFCVRMTGCPNGCSRPYMAELGFVGDGPNSYQLWLGGSPAQTRLAEPYLDRMKVQVKNSSCCFSLIYNNHDNDYKHPSLVCPVMNFNLCLDKFGIVMTLNSWSRQWHLSILWWTFELLFQSIDSKGYLLIIDSHQLQCSVARVLPLLKHDKSIAE